MDKPVRVDLGAETAANLAEIHRFFSRADEAYWLYRAKICEHTSWAPDHPQEWIPISDH